MLKESSRSIGEGKSIAEGLYTAYTQFRGFAAECVKLAQKSHSIEQRMEYVRMGIKWRSIGKMTSTNRDWRGAVDPHCREVLFRISRAVSSFTQQTSVISCGHHGH